MDLLDKEAKPAKAPVLATFKGTRIVHGHSVKTRGKNELEVMIMHRFGTFNSGVRNAFGLDEANVRIAMEYGLTDRINLGLGRSSVLKTFDGFIKYKVLQQMEGGGSPITLVAFVSVARNTNKVPPDMALNFSQRMAYCYQLLIARKFTERFSLQITPTIIHKNLVTFADDNNTQYAIGIGAREKISRSTSINAEYFYQLNPNHFQLNSIERDYFRNVISIGVDIETGGHVFQIHVSNSQTMIEKSFIAETTGDFLKGEIRLGYNLSRTFQLGAGNN